VRRSAPLLMRRRINSHPFMIGIEMSVMMRSGSVSMALWNPSCPSPPGPPRRPRRAGSPRNPDGWRDRRRSEAPEVETSWASRVLPGNNEAATGCHAATAIAAQTEAPEQPLYTVRRSPRAASPPGPVTPFDDLARPTSAPPPLLRDADDWRGSWLRGRCRKYVFALLSV
jgi:hypothetical protein